MLLYQYKKPNSLPILKLYIIPIFKASQLIKKYLLKASIQKTLGGGRRRAYQNDKNRAIAPQNSLKSYGENKNSNKKRPSNKNKRNAKGSKDKGIKSA